MHTLISYWLICQETRNEVEVNAPRLSVLGLFGFRKMTYTPRRREYHSCTTTTSSRNMSTPVLYSVNRSPVLACLFTSSFRYHPYCEQNQILVHAQSTPCRDACSGRSGASRTTCKSFHTWEEEKWKGRTWQQRKRTLANEAGRGSSRKLMLQA